MNVKNLIELKNRLTVASCNLLSTHTFGIDEDDDYEIQEIIAACSIQEAYLMDSILTNGNGLVKDSNFEEVVSTIDAIEEYLNDL